MPSENLIKYNKTILKDGLRIVSEKIPSAHSISLGIWIDVGSRDELKDENGTSHIIEHMLFKGTKKNSARKIASWLESLGGNLNAFTSREHTCYHALILDEHLKEAIEVLSDILMNSTLNVRNLEREKSVIIEEIHEMRENPSDYIYEHFSNSFWRGHPLGWSILGPEKNILTLARKNLKTYMNKHYRSERVVVSATGNVSHRKLVKLVKDKFRFTEGFGVKGEKAILPSEFSMNFLTNDSTQNHICIGFPGIPFTHPEKFSLLGLHTYLGSGMSSVLFQKIREERGMAYTIYSFADFYCDSGIAGIYFATDKSRLHEACETILKELRKVKKNKLPASKFEKIKAQIKGQLTLGMESTTGRMHRLGRQELLTGKYSSLEQSLEIIDRLKSEDLTKMARKLFHLKGMTIASLGPGSEDDMSKVDFSLL